MLAFSYTKTCSKIFATCLAALATFGGEARGAKIYHLDLVYSKIINNHEYMLPDIESKDWGEEVRFEARLRSDNNLFYLEANYHFSTCFQKVCTVGLQFSDGINIFPWMAIEHRHHSQHTADRKNSSNSETRYPLFDSIGLRFRFVQ